MPAAVSAQENYQAEKPPVLLCSDMPSAENEEAAYYEQEADACDETPEPTPRLTESQIIALCYGIEADDGCAKLALANPSFQEVLIVEAVEAALPQGRRGSILVNSNWVQQWMPLVLSYHGSRDYELALRILACESEGDPNAANPTSSARGLFQHLGKYWDDRFAAAGFVAEPPLKPIDYILDPEINIAVAAFLAKRDGYYAHWYPSYSCWKH